MYDLGATIRGSEGAICMPNCLGRRDGWAPRGTEGKQHAAAAMIGLLHGSHEGEQLFPPSLDEAGGRSITDKHRQHPPPGRNSAPRC